MRHCASTKIHSKDTICSDSFDTFASTTLDIAFIVRLTHQYKTARRKKLYTAASTKFKKTAGRARQTR